MQTCVWLKDNTVVVLHGILLQRMPYTDLTFNVTKQKLASMRETLRELSDPAATDDRWERHWWDRRRRLKQVLDFAEARAQQTEPRCLTDEYQLRRLWHLLYIIVHCPGHWEALPDSGFVTISCHALEWSESGSSAAIRSDDLEESPEETFRLALADLDALRVITWLPEASWKETACRHVEAIVREDFPHL